MSDQAFPRRAEGGFTIIELLIALTVLIIGLTGLMQLQMSGIRASSFSRHATEASVLAEDKMEALRTAPLVATVATENVDANGVVDASGFYVRNWTITDLTGGLFGIEVVVEWKERGSEDHDITLITQRQQ